MSGDGLSAEVHFAQRLAGNEKKTRDRAVKRLRKWLEIKASSSKGGLTEEDLLKIWKGLHYCMWMSDKPVIQEELASSISSLVHAFQGHQKTAFAFIKTFFQTEAREWNGIDRWRIDKFMMLVRCLLHQALVFLKNGGWESDLVEQLTDIISSQIVDVTGASTTYVPDGLKYHIIDVYMDELTQVGAAQLSEDIVLRFLEPFYLSLHRTKSQTVLNYVINHLFNKLMEEEVDRLRESEAGEESDEESDDTPFLQVDFATLADKLFELAQTKSCISRNRPVLYKLVTRMRNVANGILPAEDVEISDDEDPIKHNDIASAMAKLEKLDQHLVNDTGMSEKKKRKKAEIKALVAEEIKAQKKKKRGIKDTTNSDEEIITKKSRVEDLQSMEETPAINEKVSNKSLKKNRKETAPLKVSKPKPVFEEETNDKPPAKKKQSKKQKVYIEDSNKEKTSELDKLKDKKRKSVEVNKNVEQSKQNGVKESPSEFEEIDIWIPNKKYKGRLSAINTPSDSPVTSTPTRKKKNKAKAALSTPFAYFDSNVKTPPAFVRKSFTKLRTPKTEPLQKSKQMITPQRNPGSLKKRVSFDMKKNTSQDFEESFSMSPGAFNPLVKPDQSILKSPPPVIRSKKKGTPLQGKRLKAADFF